jgi:hypothetical protein
MNGRTPAFFFKKKTSAMLFIIMKFDSLALLLQATSEGDIHKATDLWAAILVREIHRTD